MGSRSRDGAEAVRRMVAAHLPGYRIDSVARVGEGTDNLVFEVNGELLVRWSKEADPAARAARVEREARLLAAVADISPLPVPEPSVVDPEQGCLTYRKLPGRPLLDLPDAQRSEHGGSVAATLGELLTALHAAPVEPLARLVDIDDQPLGDWRREAAETYAQVAEEVPVEYRRRVEAFLDAPPPAHEWAPVFSHNDLGIEHVLVDAGTWNVTGVIDWSDAAIMDRPLTSACSTATWAPPRTPPWPATEARSAIVRPSRSAPSSMPGAVSSRTWRTASRPDRRGTSRRALPRWPGCSRRAKAAVDRQATTCLYCAP
jgi:aminoglycoside phosphotransferase (APT) family kinase protein